MHSPLTLKIMLAVALIFVPLVIAYQAWVYILFSGKVREEELAYHERHRAWSIERGAWSRELDVGDQR